jgi:hypothetical protein
MKCIITEDQHSKLKTKLQKMVKSIGWEQSSNIVGSVENLAKLGFNDNPMNFLNLFNDLDVVQSEQKPDWTLFRNEKGKNIMIYNRKNDYVYLNFYDILAFLGDGFGLSYTETQELTQEWLSEVYNLRGVTTIINSYKS